jgi:signal transduction histidine kinase/CheY-like chemotaxis protein
MLTQELQSSSMELRDQNVKVEQKNREVEASRVALEEKAQQLAASSKYKGEFLANVSHEFRTPLNALLILAKLLAENKGGNLSPQQVEFAHTIYSSGTDLLELINNVLDLSKIEAGKLDVEPLEVDLGDVKDSVARTFEPLANEKHLTLEVCLDPSAPHSIRTDRKRLEQVLKNLLSNAIKFTERGDVTLEIRGAAPGRQFASPSLAEAANGGVVAFAVRDTGIGIALDKQQLIFEAFQQADGTTNRKFGGTGLGLSISRQIATMLGGELAVESEPNTGSTFTLFVPARFVGAATDAVAPEPRSAEAPASEADVFTARTEPETLVSETQPTTGQPVAESGKARPHVLVVDDDVRNIFALTSVLEDRGMEVSFAENGRDALTALESTSGIDVVLMDVMMPDMDGYETIRAIRRQSTFKTLPIIALTAKAMPGDQEAATAAGASEYIAKPVDPGQLVDVMKKWLSR